MRLGREPGPLSMGPEPARLGGIGDCNGHRRWECATGNSRKGEEIFGVRRPEALPARRQGLGGGVREASFSAAQSRNEEKEAVRRADRYHGPAGACGA